MSRYLVTGFNSETGEIYRGEELDQAGAEHQAVSWVERQPIGSQVQVMHVGPERWSTFEGKAQPMWPELTQVSQAKRVLGGVEWLS
jgi:hypothetical protein